jgi:outer membrane autotransporter protein
LHAIGDQYVDSELHIDNIRIINNFGPGTANSAAAISVFSGNERGILELSNSLFANNGNGINLGGYISATITNSVFTNNGSSHGANAIYAIDDPGESMDIRINMDRNAPNVIKWESNKPSDLSSLASTAPSIFMNLRGSGSLGFNIASGKILDLHGEIIGRITGGFLNPDLTGDKIALTKTGGGVLKIRDGGGFPIAGFDNSIDVGILGGTLHFGENSIWSSIGGMHVGSAGVFKPSLRINRATNAAGPSLFIIDRFTSVPGARLEIGNVSALPFVGVQSETSGNTITTHTTWYPPFPMILLTGNADDSNVVPSLSIDNQLLKARMTPGSQIEGADAETIYLQIEKVNNLSSLPGIGEYADVYRRLETLSDLERDTLDYIYNTGGAGPGVMGFLQTLGGSIVDDSLLALRHNLAQTRRNIMKRVTAYQREELEDKIPSISASHYPSLIEHVDENDYSGIFAYIDQTWLDQDDVGNIAGHKYNTHGIGIGYEKHDGSWIFGGLFRYDGGTMKLKSNSATRTDIDSFQVAGYASWAQNGYYATGAVHAGFGWNNENSVYGLPGLPGAAASGEFLTSMAGISSEFGYMMDGYLWGNNFRLTPHGGVSYARLDRESFTESGGGSLNRHFGSAGWDLLEFGGGVRMSMTIERERYVLLPYLDVSYQHSLGAPAEGKTDVTLLANPAGSWRAEVIDSIRGSVNVATGISARLQSGLTIGAEVDLEFRRSGLTAQAGLNMSKGF